MNGKLKSLTAAVLAVVVTVALAFSVSPKVNAATVTYDDASSSYKGSTYYTKLTQVEITGDFRTDIVNIAKSQIGYQEGASEGQYDGTLVANGDNYTEYGRWYGIPNGQWCAMFVSWCAYIAGVDEGVIKYHSYTETQVDFLQEKNQCYDWDVVKSGAYVPEPGDVVYFYGGTAGRTVTHVGLVEKFENNILYTIEGNTSPGSFTTDGGCCYGRSYNFNSTYVKYICRPAYEYATGRPATEGSYYNELGFYSVKGGLNLRNMPSSTAAGTDVVGSYGTGEIFECLEIFPDADPTKSKCWARVNYNGNTAYTAIGIANVNYLGKTLDRYTNPYKVSTDKAVYEQGEDIIVSASGTKSADWIGIYKKGEVADTSNGGVLSIFWEYISELSNGKVAINEANSNIASRDDAADFVNNNLPVGEYVAYLLADDSYNVVATAEFEVVEPATPEPTAVPTATPTAEPTAVPTEAPTAAPTAIPTEVPTAEPTVAPTEEPTVEPTDVPTDAPTTAPTAEATAEPDADAPETSDSGAFVLVMAVVALAAVVFKKEHYNI